MQYLTKIIEAALYAASRPLTIDELKGLDRSANARTVREALDELRQQLDDADHAVELGEIGGGFQLLTRQPFAEVLERARLVQRPRRLSRAALETLAIIAYRQPVSRLEVEDIRGVSSEGVVRMLLERELIDVSGRGEGLGRPLLYSTTPYFLEHLGLNTLEELPRADELGVSLRPRGPVTIGDDDDDEDDEDQGPTIHEAIANRAARESTRPDPPGPEDGSVPLPDPVTHDEEEEDRDRSAG